MIKGISHKNEKRFVGKNVAMDIVDTFLSTAFSEGERHKRRIAAIEAVDD